MPKLDGTETKTNFAARVGLTKGRISQLVAEGLRVRADGRIDVYPRLGPTSEWDVGAGLALVMAAGGKVTDADGAPLRFGTGRTGFLVPGFIAWGDPAAAPGAVDAQN